MLIKVDDQGREAIKQLCDVALKFGGLTNLEAVSFILHSVQVEKQEENNPEPVE